MTKTGLESWPKFRHLILCASWGAELTVFFIFFYLFNWSIIALQCCVSFAAQQSELAICCCSITKS